MLNIHKLHKYVHVGRKWQWSEWKCQKKKKWALNVQIIIYFQIIIDQIQQKVVKISAHADGGPGHE